MCIYIYICRYIYILCTHTCTHTHMHQNARTLSLSHTLSHTLTHTPLHKNAHAHTNTQQWQVKAVYAFQRVDEGEYMVLCFGMYVQEYGTRCAPAHAGRVYIQCTPPPSRIGHTVWSHTCRAPSLSDRSLLLLLWRTYFMVELIQLIAHNVLESTGV